MAYQTVKFCRNAYSNTLHMWKMTFAPVLYDVYYNITMIVYNHCLECQRDDENDPR